MGSRSTVRSLSHTRLCNSGWTPPPSLPISLPTPTSPSATSNHLAATPDHTRRSEKKKQTQFSLAESSASGEDEPEAGESGPDAEFKSLEKQEMNSEEIIKWQVRQPIKTVDSHDLDSLLPFGIADYTFVYAAPSDSAQSPAPVCLGKGKFSRVLLAKKGNVEYAIKHTQLKGHHPLIASRLLREPTILAQLLPHPNLVQVFETIHTTGHFYLVEENLSEGVTLESFVVGKRDGVLNPHEAWSILDQLSSVVKSLHVPLKVCHRDIKPENMLVISTHTHGQKKSKLALKLLDFGLATHFSGSEPKLTTCCGSPAYHSPELWKSLREPAGTVRYWGPEVDIWCVGLTLLRCLTGQKYPIGTSHSSLAAINDKLFDSLLLVQDEELRDVLRSFLCLDGTERMSAFDDFCASRSAITAVSMGSRESKHFKTTKFEVTQKVFNLDLHLVSPKFKERTRMFSTSSRDHSKSRIPSSKSHVSINTMHLRSISPTRKLVQSASTPQIPVLIEDSSTSLVAHVDVTQSPETITKPLRKFSMSIHTLPPPPIQLLLHNPSRISFQRAISYIKYALRCEGMLYHVRESENDSGFSMLSPAESIADKVCGSGSYILECAMPMPLDDRMKASTALKNALRPQVFRTASDTSFCRSSSTPPTRKKSQPSKVEVKVITFLMSIQRGDREVELKDEGRGRSHMGRLPERAESPSARASSCSTARASSRTSKRHSSKLDINYAIQESPITDHYHSEELPVDLKGHSTDVFEKQDQMAKPEKKHYRHHMTRRVPIFVIQLSDDRALAFVKKALGGEMDMETDIYEEENRGRTGSQVTVQTRSSINGRKLSVDNVDREIGTSKQGILDLMSKIPGLVSRQSSVNDLQEQLSSRKEDKPTIASAQLAMGAVTF